MRAERFLVLVKKCNAPRMQYLIRKQARPGWEQLIEINELVEKKDVRKKDSVPSSQVTNDLLLRWHNGEFKKILAEKDLAFLPDLLLEHDVPLREISFATIFDEINSELKKRKFHWLTHSDTEWKKSGIQYANPQEWQQQFAELGYGWVGEALLKQLRVITASDLRQAFNTPPEDMLGLKTGHAYFKDAEAGSSSIAIKDILEHLYKDVIECDLDHEKPFGNFSGDILYLYEDGLWSGVELVKRLQKLQDACSRHYPHTQIQFRFGVSSDAGLLAGRCFLKRTRMVHVMLNAGKLNHINFLKEHEVATINLSNFTDDESFRKNIDKIVDPYAFKDSELWMERQKEAKEICTSIWKQLVHQWIKQTTSNEELEHKVEKWALGAFSFSSTFAFSKSVPKPVLPLFWLSGGVKVGSRQINWKPLFWDVRRSGSVPFTQTR